MKDFYDKFNDINKKLSDIILKGKDKAELDALLKDVESFKNKGQVVALKALVNHIIVRKQTFDFYNNLTEEKCDEIHENGYLTPVKDFTFTIKNCFCF